MNFFAPILAEAEVTGSDVIGAWSFMTEEARYRLFTFSAYAIVIAALLAWVIFIRKQKTKRRRIYKHQPHTWQQSDDGKKRRRSQRHRHRRSSAAPQNPSLAAAGGLPPRRPDDVPPRGT